MHKRLTHSKQLSSQRFCIKAEPLFFIRKKDYFSHQASVPYAGWRLKPAREGDGRLAPYLQSIPLLDPSHSFRMTHAFCTSLRVTLGFCIRSNMMLGQGCNQGDVSPSLPPFQTLQNYYTKLKMELFSARSEHIQKSGGLNKSIL